MAKTVLTYRVGRKKLNKILFTILVFWQLLFGFCLILPMLCDCDIKKKDCYCCVFQNDSTERQSSTLSRAGLSALPHAGQKAREVANLVKVSRTTVYAIKKCLDNGEGVNRRAGSGRKTVVDRDSLPGFHSRDCLLTMCAEYYIYLLL